MVSSRHTSFPATLSHFFSIILSHNFRDTGLKIPKKFMKEHGKNMSNQVSLYVPGGGLWQVELININNGEFWLKKGWCEFADRYSVQYGYFLVFRYEGNSVFNVIIFDMSASEIEYPTKHHVNGDSQKGADQGTRDDHPTRKTYFLRSTKPKVESVIKSEEGKLEKEFKSSQTNMMKTRKGAEGIQTDAHSTRKKSPVTCILRSKKTKVDSVINPEKVKLNEEFQSSQTNMMKSQKGQEVIRIDDHSTRRKSPVTYLLLSKKAKVDPVIKSEEGKLNEEVQVSQTDTMKVGFDTSIEMKAQAPNGNAERREALQLANAFKSNINNI